MPCYSALVSKHQWRNTVVHTPLQVYVNKYGLSFATQDGCVWRGGGAVRVHVINEKN
jgi:hypothetical protein